MIRTPVRIAAALVIALVLGASPATAGSLLDTVGSDDRAIVDLTGAIDLTTTVAAASLPEQASGIGPGSHLLIDMDGGTYGCTASYVWQSGGSLLLGAAGHCFLPETTTATHGPGADHDPADTSVSVCVADCSFGGLSGFIFTGTLVELGPLRYARQESPSGVQIGHDFGVVEIPADLRDLVRTTMPVFGGPTGAATLSTGDQVCHYGNGIGFGEVFPTMGRSGLGIFADAEAWFAASAAAPGDSGSALQTCTLGPDGLEGVDAVGTLTHLSSLGVAGTTNAQSVAMANDDAGLTLSLVLDADALPDPGDSGGSNGVKAGKGGNGGKGGPPEGRGSTRK